jgi:hypothetical protein
MERDACSEPMMGAIQQSDTILPVVLAAGVHQTVAIPSGARSVLFACSGGNDFYMLFSNSSSTSIAVPTVTSSSSGPELNPLMRSCRGWTYVSLISAAICVITMSFYGNPTI